MTFTLTGFSTVRREGIELSGRFTATIDANLPVGSLAEAITVTGESPIVDVKSARREQVVNRELLTSIPSARTYQTMVGLAPGVIAERQSGCRRPQQPGDADVRDPRRAQTEGRVMVDGMNAGGARGGAGVSNYQVDVANAQELTYTLSGGLGEAETGGPTMNVVPRTGGNKFTGSLFFSGANSAMQGSNLTDELRAAGLRDPNELIKAWEVNGAFGGPIVQRSSLVLPVGQKSGHASLRVGHVLQQERRQSQCVDLRTRPEQAGHLRRHLDPGAAAPDVAGHAAQQVQHLLGRAADVPRVRRRWSRRWFADGRAGGVGRHMGHRFSAVPPGDLDVADHEPAAGGRRLSAHFRTKYGRQNADADLISVTEQGGAIPGLIYRSGGWLRNLTDTPRWRASLSYVTGAHNMKFGYEGQHLSTNGGTYFHFPSMEYRFNNGVPNQLTMRVNPLLNNDRVNGTALYAQDQWSRPPAVGAGSGPLRSRIELQHRRAVRAVAVCSRHQRASRRHRCRCLQRRLAARRAGLRPVRQRQDLAASERRPVPRPVAGGWDLHRQQSDRHEGDLDDPFVERREP